MELTLQKKTYSCYEAAMPLFEKREQAAETIVPDYCPDIARIIDSCACLLIHSKDVSEGRVCVSGTIKLSLLYMAEGGGVKSIDYALALEEYFDLRSLEDCRDVCPEISLGIPEVRLVNPRKVFTRVGVTFRLTPYCRDELAVCSGVEQECEYGIHTLCEEQKSCIIKAIKEKDFTISEDISLSVKEDIREILCGKSQLRITEAKAAGGKVFLKGLVCSDFVCCLESGALHRESSELPFSQIIDGVSDEDGVLSAHACAYLTGCEYRIGSENAPEDAQCIGVKLFASAFVAVHQSVTAQAITDLYSTSHELTVEMQGKEVCREKDSIVKEESVREQLETGVEAAEILKSEVTFTQSSLSAQDGKAYLRASAVLKVLYLDEGGVPFCAQRQSEVTAKVELPENCTAAIEDICCGELRAVPSGSGIEFRFSALFTVSLERRCRCSTLCSLQVQPRGEAEGRSPSLILKPLMQGQRLWDLAKQHRTSVEDILSANELEDERDPAVGDVLLIPRRR